MNENTQLAVQKKTVLDLISSDDFKSRIAAIMPKSAVDRYVRMTISALHRVPALQKCSKESLFQCLYDLSAIGLEPDGRCAHLIPFGDKCTLIIDYKGLVELAMRSGEVASIHADVVCENDVFEYDMGQIRAHKIDFKKPRGPMYAAYCKVGLRNADEPKCEVMTKEDVDSIRKRSKASGSGPWVTDYNEMAKKTVFRRASKWLPLSPELREKIENDDHNLEPPAARLAEPIFVNGVVVKEEPTGLTEEDKVALELEIGK